MSASLDTSDNPGGTSVKLPKIGPRKTVYQNRFQHIYSVDADFGGITRQYNITETGRRSGIAVVIEGSVLMVRQYRLLINRLSWEIPGGKVDEGETPAEAATRECLEETGVRCFDPRPLIFYQPALDTVYNPTHLFYSTEVARELEPEFVDQQEVAGYEWVPLSRCTDMIGQGQIVDSFTILGILSYSTLVASQ